MTRTAFLREVFLGAASLYLFVSELRALGSPDPAMRRDLWLVFLRMLQTGFALFLLPGLYVIKFLQWIGWLSYGTYDEPNVLQFKLFAYAINYTILVIVLCRFISSFWN